MIRMLRGVLREKSSEGALIEVGGIGFLVGMSSNAIASLPPIGEEALVHTYLAVREDALSLFGFVDAAERELFLRLIGVSGVGPKVALAALSTFTPQVFRELLSEGDVKRMSTVPGIGKKTAQRIVLELQGILEDDFLRGAGGPSARDGSLMAQAMEALLGMGFTSAEAQTALEHHEGDLTDVGEVVRYALKRLGANA